MRSMDITDALGENLGNSLLLVIVKCIEFEELMVLKEHYDEALGDQANDITRAIQDGEGRVLVVHDLA